jgi:hypothetical protein
MLSGIESTILLVQKLSNILRLLEDLTKRKAIDYLDAVKDAENIIRSVNGHCNALQVFQHISQIHVLIIASLRLLVFSSCLLLLKNSLFFSPSL